MPQLKLTAQLGLNKTGFDAGMKAATAAVENTASKITKKLGGAIIGAFSIQKIIAFANEAMRQAVTIDRLAKKYNLTTGEVQLLQQETKRTGMSFEDLVEDAKQLELTLARLRGGDTIFSRRMIEDLDNAHEVLNEFKLQAGMGLAKLVGLAGGDANNPELAARQEEFLEKRAAERREAVQQAKDETEIAEMEKKTAELRERALPKEERLALLNERRTKAFDELSQMPNVRAKENAAKHLEIAKLDADIASLTGKPDTDSSVRGPGAIQSSALGAVGAFTGTSGQAQLAGQMGEVAGLLEDIKLAMTAKGIVVRDVAPR